MTERARERGGSLPAAIARIGFDDPERVLRLLSDPAVADLIHTTERIEDEGLAASLSRTADPDAAALGVVRLMETAASDPELYAELTSALSVPGQARERVTKVLGASVALTDHLVAHPRQWRAAADAGDLTAEQRTDRLVEIGRASCRERV